MRTDKLLPTLIQGSIGVLSLCGCSDKQPDESQKTEALKNKDGNYNILFILNDQEKYMAEFPMGTDYKGRSSLERYFKDYYLNCIQDADNQLQHLLAYLKENGLLKNTIIILSSDHGEMMGAHGLKGKGGFMYEENIHVPLVIYHPEYEGKRSCNSITSHLDITPTILDMTHADNKQELASALKGQSMMPLLANPSLPHRNTEGALFVFDMLSMIDGNFAVSPFDRTYKIHMNKRGFLRGMVNEEYKFARYFSPKGFNTPTNLQELYDNNDVEIFAKGSDETDNLGHYADKADALFRKAIAERYNKKLNLLIEREIGVDDGRETAKYVGGLDPYERK